jgi:type IV pilus assembly protein PilA
MNTSKQKGFSLIELLIVVSIMLVIAAVAIPAVTAANQAGREAAVASTLKTVVTANVGYKNLFPSIGYAALAKNLGEGGTSACPETPDSTGIGACLMAKAVADNLDAGSASTGYTYTYTVTNAGAGYNMTAKPTTAADGRKSYFVDQSGTIVYAWGMQPPASVAAGTILGK